MSQNQGTKISNKKYYFSKSFFKNLKIKFLEL